MGRIDFPSTQEGFEEFKRYCQGYLGKGKMKLLVVNRKEAILRTRLATRYDSAYISGLGEEQVKDLEQFVGNRIEVWHVFRFFWDEEVKMKVEE